MKPATNTLTEIFNAAVRYVVPLYQRPYVWDKSRHWEPLWQDITIVLEHYLAGDGEPTRHFLGAIVLDQEDTAPGEAVRRLIIDGQQRLTTLQLLLAAAANTAADAGAERQARLLMKLVENDPDLTAGDDRFKVWPTNANQSAFRSVMQRGGPPSGTPKDPNNTIHEAYAYFAKAITDWVNEDSPTDAQRQERHEALRVALSSLLQIVSINLEPGDNAQVIFETLNARGTPLLAMDLVKNALLYRAQREHADVDQLNEKVWEPELGQEYWRTSARQGRLTRPRAELFLMHWLAMRLGRIVPATELFTQFRTHVLDAADRPRAEDLVNDLCRDAGVLRSFESHPPGSVEERFFRHLDVLDTTTLLPVALLLYRSDDIAPDRRRTAIQALESWLVRRMLCGLTASAYNRLVSDLLKLLKADLQRADEVVVRFLRSSTAGSAIWPDDERLTGVLTERPMYGWINQRRVVMVLSAVELHRRQSNKVEDIYALPSNLTIEHVMPQSWTKHWPLDEAEDEARRARIDRLGNLTLTSGPLNSALSNAGWDSKRPELAKHSLLMLNQQITAHAHWDEAAIDRRGEKLAANIAAIWPGPDDSRWPTSTSTASEGNPHSGE